MNKVWPVVFGLVVGLAIIALLAFGGSDRESYWVARGPMTTHVVIVQPASDTVVLYRMHHYFER